MTATKAEDGDQKGTPDTGQAAAIASIREAAKWMATAYAAAGAVILSSVPLVDSWKAISSVPTFLAVAAGMTLGLVGVGVAVYVTTEVLLTPALTLRDVDNDEHVSAALEDLPQLHVFKQMLGHDEKADIGLVIKTYDEFAAEVYRAYWEAIEAHGTDEQDAKLDQYGKRTDQFSTINRVLTSIEAHANHQSLLSRFNRSRRIVLYAAIAAGSGVLILAASSLVTEPPQARPTLHDVFLSPDGMAMLERELPDACLPVERVLRLGGDPTSPRVTTVPPPQCQEVLSFRLDAPLGQLLSPP